MKKVTSVFTVVLSLVVCYGKPVEAAGVQRSFASDAVANCQPAMPTFEGNIRKRPMALANEGNTTVFITCGSEHHNAEGLALEVYFVNRAGSPNAVVQCSLVIGFITRGLVLTKASEPIIVGSQGWIQWTVDDNLGFLLNSPTLSCALPPGVDIVGTVITFAEYVGE